MKKKLEAELYYHDESTEESIYAIYEMKNGEKTFLGGLYMPDCDVLDECDSEDEFDDVAKDIALGYAEDGGELMTMDVIKDWIQGVGCEI